MLFNYFYKRTQIQNTFFDELKQTSLVFWSACLQGDRRQMLSSEYPSRLSVEIGGLGL